MTFKSELRNHGYVALPAWSGIRVMMMPYRIHDPGGSLPHYLAGWLPALELASGIARYTYRVSDGIGYLTIDEALVRKGETHRRPGLHVDGVGEDGGPGAYGGDGGYAARGMLVVASHAGCVAFDQDFEGAPGRDGDCAHLEHELDDRGTTVLEANRIYWCSPMTVHASFAMPEDTHRQFCRVSFPSSAPWHEGYTPNPLGIQPAGPIRGPRGAQMAYRASGGRA